MADHTKIEWTEATWNPITGCSVYSPGCTHCYAMKLAGTRLQHHASRKALTRPSKSGPVWTGEVRFNEAWLTQPLRWKRPRMIFVCAHGDLFHESVPDAWIDRVFAVMALAPQHTFQVLTKRSARMRDYLSRDSYDARMAIYLLCNERKIDNIIDTHMAAAATRLHAWPLPNVWLGVSVEDQTRADERIPDLLATPAAVRWISAEPLLGPVDLHWALGHRLNIAVGFLERGQFSPGLETLRHLDWIVTGGESGPGARPMHPDWARSLRDQSASAGVPFFFKQWGEHWPAELCPDQGDNTPWRFRPDGTAAWALNEHGTPRADLEAVSFTRVGKKIAGRLLDGIEHNAMPGQPHA